jgi:hypothetical protein
VCGERFTSRNQWHACGRYDLDTLFQRSSAGVKALYRRFRKLVEACGPVTVIPQKTRVAFQVRMRFAALMPRKDCLVGHLVLASRREAPCFERIETYSPRNHLHLFRLESEDDLTPELARFVKEAYAVGKQEHLKTGGRTRVAVDGAPRRRRGQRRPGRSRRRSSDRRVS